MMITTAALFATGALAKEYVVDVPALGELIGFQRHRLPPSLVGYPDVAQFLGIPFAKPPLGELRWQPPQAHGAWDSPRKANRYPHSCMQTAGLPSPGTNSEDCLFLNVAAPTAALNATDKLPVMFWIHGGAHVQGSANGYPIDALVAGSGHEVVLVATNYRLGVLGFLGSKDIQGRTSDGSAGNFGIQDQQLAMVWVRDHIAAFGGDGSDVTIFGESAGGKSTINHLAAPASGGLFKKAIIESGAYDYGADPMEAAEAKYQDLRQKVACKDLACLLAADAAKLIDAQGGEIGPVVDGVWLKEAPWDSIAHGRYHKEVPVMLGGNRDEVALFAFLDGTPADLTEEQFDAKLGASGYDLSPEELKQLKQIYDPAVYPFPKDLAKYSIWWWTYVRAATDTVPGLGPCGARRVARHLVKGGSPAVYSYLFAKAIGELKPLLHGMTPHGFEIPFVMGDANLFPFKKEKEVARAASALWSSFAIHGVPASEGLPEWPQYNADDDEVMRFDDAPSVGGIHTQKGLRKDACDFWDAHLAPRNQSSLVKQTSNVASVLV